MTLLDAYALVALLADEPAAAEVEALIRGGESSVTAVNLAEAIDVTCRIRRVPEGELRGLLEPLLDELVEVVGQDGDDAWRASAVRVEYYDRRSCALSLADCFLVAAATGERVATADPALAAVLRARGTDVVALPDSAGDRP